MSPGVLENVPELIHHIQSRLMAKEGARTSVLSKSWLHAWSTIPTLRFQIVVGTKSVKLVDIERTLIRYLRDNIPIESFDLYIYTPEPELELELVEKCIRTTAMATTLKELSLKLIGLSGSVTMPDEILSSCENLTKLRIMNESPSFSFDRNWKTSHSVIKCVSLQQLSLKLVRISQELLDAILSSCRLLVKIELILCSHGLNTIKVKNLPCLSELTIYTGDRCSTPLEIDHVPNLRSFICNLHLGISKPIIPFTAHSISLGSSRRLTELRLGDMITDDASLGMITSPGVVPPFLETLTINMGSWRSRSFHFTSATIKRLSLHDCRQSLVDVKVYAPNLLFFYFDGYGNPMPSLLFPVSTLINETTFRVRPEVSIDASFFLKLKEAFALSSNCHLNVETFDHDSPPGDINIDDLRTSPAMKVQRLSFRIVTYDECLWERSPFIDALFEICHPSYVTLTHDTPFKFKHHFCTLMFRVLEKKKKKTTTTTTTVFWPGYLKHVQIRRRQKWETFTATHIRFLGGLTRLQVDFKLTWRPH